MKAAAEESENVKKTKVWSEKAYNFKYLFDFQPIESYQIMKACKIISER